MAPLMPIASASRWAITDMESAHVDGPSMWDAADVVGRPSTEDGGIATVVFTYNSSRYLR